MKRKPAKIRSLPLSSLQAHEFPRDCFFLSTKNSNHARFRRRAAKAVNPARMNSEEPGSGTPTT